MKGADSTLDYPLALKELCRDVCRRLPEFRHIDVERMGFSLARANNRGSKFGRWASMTPLLFEGGTLATALVHNMRVRTPSGVAKIGAVTKYYKIPEVVSPDRKHRLMYIFTIMTPRFYNLTVEEKLETIMHELYHVDPAFNGDVRRFPGRNWKHGSKGQYDAVCRKLRSDWLGQDPDPRLYSFLQWNYRQLFEHFDSIRGWRYPGIKLIEIGREEAIRLNPALK